MFFLKVGKRDLIKKTKSSYNFGIAHDSNVKITAAKTARRSIVLTLNFDGFSCFTWRSAFE